MHCPPCRTSAMLVVACALFLPTKLGLCEDIPLREHHMNEKDFDHLYDKDFAEEGDEDDEDDEDDEGTEAGFLEEDEDNGQEPDASEAGDGEPPDDHPMSQHRRRGVLEDGEDPTTPPIADIEESTTSSTTPYPLGVVGPDPLAVDPNHEQQLGPVAPWPTAGAQHWSTQIAATPPMEGVQPVTDCTGRRREDRRRDQCKGSYRRRRRTDIYSSRAEDECADRRRTDRRRTLCEISGTRRRRSRRRDPSLGRRRRTRRRRVEQAAVALSHPSHDRRRRYGEGDGLTSFSLQQDDVDHQGQDQTSQNYTEALVSADGSSGHIDEKVDSGNTSDYKAMTRNTREFDQAFKSMSGDAGHLLDESTEMLKRLDNILNSSTVNSASVNSTSAAGVKPLSTPETLSVDAQAAMLRRHIN